MGWSRSDVALGLSVLAAFVFMLLWVSADALGRRGWQMLMADVALLHVALGFAVWARLGDPNRRGKSPGLALAVAGLLVLLWWAYFGRAIATFADPNGWTTRGPYS